MKKNFLIILLLSGMNFYTDKINQGLKTFYNNLDRGQIIQSTGGDSIILPDGKTTQIFEDDPVMVTSNSDLTSTQIQAQLVQQDPKNINRKIRSFVDPLGDQLQQQVRVQVPQQKIVQNEQIPQQQLVQQEQQRPQEIKQVPSQSQAPKRIIAQSQISFNSVPEGQLIQLEEIPQPTIDTRYGQNMNDQQKMMLAEYDEIERQKQEQKRKQEQLIRQQQQMQLAQQMLANNQQLPENFQGLPNTEFIQYFQQLQNQQQQQQNQGKYDDVIQQLMNDISHREFAQSQIQSYENMQQSNQNKQKQIGSDKSDKLNSLINGVVSQQAQRFYGK